MTWAETGWIQTATGKKVHPLDPRAEGIDIQDIAHALSHTCRYGGHCKTFYSVAQHSILVSQECPRHPLHALLHDASEAYLVDLPRPIKQALRQAGNFWFDQAEDRLMQVVWQRFGLAAPDETNQIQAEIDAADRLLLVTEGRDLMAPLHPEWHYSEANGYLALPERIIPWTPGRSEIEFLRRFQALAGGN